MGQYGCGVPKVQNILLSKVCNNATGQRGYFVTKTLFGSPDIDRNPSQAVYKSIEQVSDLAPVVAFYGMFRNVWKMINMNDFSDNDLRKTSLSIVFPKRGENENNITTARCFL